MQYAENFLTAYRAMKKSGDMVSYSNKEPYWSSQINKAAILSAEMDF